MNSPELTSTAEVLYSILQERLPDITLEQRTSLARELAAARVTGPKLAVWYGAMPESNGKRNWTAILHRAGEGFRVLSEGIALDRSEYPDRVRYEADRARYLIGELAEEPDITDYDTDLCEPVEAPRERAQVSQTPSGDRAPAAAPRYSVGPNRCTCHPETCACNPWAVFDGTQKHSTHYRRETADEVADALNGTSPAPTQEAS